MIVKPVKKLPIKCLISFRSCVFLLRDIAGIFIYGMLVAELLALLRTALDSESSDGEEIYPLVTQSRRHCDPEQP